MTEENLIKHYLEYSADSSMAEALKDLNRKHPHIAALANPQKEKVKKTKPS